MIALFPLLHNSVINKIDVYGKDIHRRKIMKLYVLSDLHLEFSTFEPFKTDADVVVLAGDIGKGTSGIEWARNAFPDKEIVYVPGNHEFYGTQRPETLAGMRIAAQKNGVHLLDKDELVIGNVHFLGCTLWTDFLLFRFSMVITCRGTLDTPSTVVAGNPP